MREVHVPLAWPDAGVVAEMPTWFRLDRTTGQKRAFYVAAEKDTLGQQLTGWLEFAGIPVLVVRGFSSQSYADVVRDRVAHEQRGACLLVVGDFDCSGEDIERDWVERTGCWSSVTRVLLTYEQMRAYGLPATEGKRGDLRWLAFARRYGFDIECPVQWEERLTEPGAAGGRLGSLRTWPWSCWVWAGCGRIWPGRPPNLGEWSTTRCCTPGLARSEYGTAAVGFRPRCGHQPGDGWPH
ncbi:hypothetical protein [Streptomyces sp. NPDC059072]|uniref:hypothetical protein n=1 Tax=Streptomyces sp. NPDC059072 TaxID=3346715 RepID=UPI0036B5A341